MNTLKVLGTITTIVILRILLKIRGGKRITINWQDKEAVEIPIRRR